MPLRKFCVYVDNFSLLFRQPSSFSLSLLCITSALKIMFVSRLHIFTLFEYGVSTNESNKRKYSVHDRLDRVIFHKVLLRYVQKIPNLVLEL